MLIKYIIHLFMFMLITAGMHEFFHLTLLKLLGGEGYIGLSFWGAYIIPERMPPRGAWIALLGGGFLTALTLTILGLWFENEPEEKAAVLPHILTQITYGICEALIWPILPISKFILITNIITFTLFILGSIIGIARWLLRPKTFY